MIKGSWDYSTRQADSHCFRMWSCFCPNVYSSERLQSILLQWKAVSRLGNSIKKKLSRKTWHGHSLVHCRWWFIIPVIWTWKGFSPPLHCLQLLWKHLQSENIGELPKLWQNERNIRWFSMTNDILLVLTKTEECTSHLMEQNYINTLWQCGYVHVPGFQFWFNRVLNKRNFQWLTK